MNPFLGQQCRAEQVKRMSCGAAGFKVTLVKAPDDILLTSPKDMKPSVGAYLRASERT